MARRRPPEVTSRARTYSHGERSLKGHSGQPREGVDYPFESYSKMRLYPFELIAKQRRESTLERGLQGSHERGTGGGKAHRE